jgi:hypothetical protein
VRVLLVSAVALVGAAIAQAQDAPDAYLGDRMPYAAFDRLPLTRITVPSGEVAIGIAPGALDLPRHPRVVWAELAAGSPKGSPQPGDRGLDPTPTWGLTYWGGALFALLADIEIRRQTQNRLGLQDALRAILAAGNIETASSLEPVLAVGDQATGTAVLVALYARMKDRPAPVDLDTLWEALGVRLESGAARLDDAAPLAAIRPGDHGATARAHR